MNLLILFLSHLSPYFKKKVPIHLFLKKNKKVQHFYFRRYKVDNFFSFYTLTNNVTIFKNRIIFKGKGQFNPAITTSVLLTICANFVSKYDIIWFFFYFIFCNFFYSKGYLKSYLLVQNSFWIYVLGRYNNVRPSVRLVDNLCKFWNNIRHNTMFLLLWKYNL